MVHLLRAVVWLLAIDRAIPTDCSGVGNLSHAIAELSSFLSTEEVTRLMSFVGAGPIADTHNPCFHAPKTTELRAEETLFDRQADGVPYACLPGVLIVGAHKSGSTDLFSRYVCQTEALQCTWVPALSLNQRVAVHTCTLNAPALR